MNRGFILAPIYAGVNAIRMRDSVLRERPWDYRSGTDTASEWDEMGAELRRVEAAVSFSSPSVSLPQGRYWPVLTLLANGTLLEVGGFDMTGGTPTFYQPVPLNGVELLRGLR